MRFPGEYAIAALMLLAATPALAEGPTRVIHTPWLALRFEQDGAEVPLRHTDTLLTEVHMRPAPFTIVLPVRGDDDFYRLAAWSDDALFTAVKPELRARAWEEPETPEFFSVYRCMADTAAGAGLLIPNLEGHHCLTGLRLGPDRDRHVFHVSDVDGPIEQVSGPLYLVGYFDENADEVMQHGEYEFLILHFDRSGSAAARD